MPPKKTTPSKEEVKETKLPTLKVYAQWLSFSPDCRPYKPSTPELAFDPWLKIVVNVPLDKELIDNATVIMSAQLSNQPEPSPIFTPLGMRYIIDQFEEVMKNGQLEVPASEDDEDWDEEPAKIDKPLDRKDNEADEWEDEAKPTKEEEEDKPWDDEWEE
jgi:hypothetical protein